jgi:hypothetical protein
LYELNAINTDVSQQYFQTNFIISKQPKTLSLVWLGAKNLGDTKKRIEILESQVSTDYDTEESSGSTSTVPDPNQSTNSEKDTPVSEKDMEEDFWVYDIE